MRPSYNIRFFANSLKFGDILLQFPVLKLDPGLIFFLLWAASVPEPRTDTLAQQATVTGWLTKHNRPD